MVRANRLPSEKTRANSNNHVDGDWWETVAEFSQVVDIARLRYVARCVDRRVGSNRAWAKILPRDVPQKLLTAEDNFEAFLSKLSPRVRRQWKTIAATANAPTWRLVIAKVPLDRMPADLLRRTYRDLRFRTVDAFAVACNDHEGHHCERYHSPLEVSLVRQIQFVCGPSSPKSEGEARTIDHSGPHDCLPSCCNPGLLSDGLVHELSELPAYVFVRAFKRHQPPEWSPRLGLNDPHFSLSRHDCRRGFKFVSVHLVFRAAVTSTAMRVRSALEATAGCTIFPVVTVVRRCLRHPWWRSAAPVQLFGRSFPRLVPVEPPKGPIVRPDMLGWWFPQTDGPFARAAGALIVMDAVNIFALLNPLDAWGEKFVSIAAAKLVTRTVLRSVLASLCAPYVRGFVPLPAFVYGGCGLLTLGFAAQMRQDWSDPKLRKKFPVMFAVVALAVPIAFTLVRQVAAPFKPPATAVLAAGMRATILYLDPQSPLAEARGMAAALPFDQRDTWAAYLAAQALRALAVTLPQLASELLVDSTSKRARGALRKTPAGRQLAAAMQHAGLRLPERGPLARRWGSSAALALRVSLVFAESWILCAVDTAGTIRADGKRLGGFGARVSVALAAGLARMAIAIVRPRPSLPEFVSAEPFRQADY